MMTEVAARRRRRIISDLTMPGELDVAGNLTVEKFMKMMNGELSDGSIGTLTPEQVLKSQKYNSINILKNAAQAQPQQEAPRGMLLMEPEPKYIVDSIPGGIMIMDDLNPMGDVFERIYDTAKSGLFYAIMKAIPTGGGLIGGIKGTLDNMAKQSFDAHVKTNFPALIHYYAFSKGSSTIKQYYTIEFEKNGVRQENPVYIHGPGTPHKLNQEQIAQLAIACMDNPIASDDINEAALANSYNFYWGKTEAEMRFTNSDLKNIEDPGHFRKRLAKLDLYLIQQSGKITEEPLNPSILPPGVTSAKLKIYGEPGWLDRMLFHGVIGNHAYDILDAPYNLMVAPLIGKSKVTNQAYLEGEMDVITKAIRNMWNKRPDLVHYT
ncbi:MAG: hypothetical protein JW754_03560 [Candidatus Aenigmarchaeota archaeon]|nr:hypothetical protein [Candidatus Aenigmarchaeota archaeon]